MVTRKWPRYIRTTSSIGIGLWQSFWILRKCNKAIFSSYIGLYTAISCWRDKCMHSGELENKLCIRFIIQMSALSCCSFLSQNPRDISELCSFRANLFIWFPHIGLNVYIRNSNSTDHSFDQLIYASLTSRLQTTTTVLSCSVTVV